MPFRVEPIFPLPAAASLEHDCIFESYEVEPSAAAWPTCHCSEFVADLTQFLTGFVEKFCRERSASDAGAVGFEYAEDPSDL